MDELLREGERLDDLQCKGYKIIQNKEKFCFGIDAVLLTNFAKIKEDEGVLDLGTGTGIIPILLEAKTKGGHFTGLEIQEESADMACRSVLYNKIQEKVEIVTGDIKEASKLFGKASYDVVTTNPPYMNHQHGLVNQTMPKAIARHEILCSYEDVIREASSVLKEKGRFYMVHRPFRFAELIKVMVNYRLEPKRIRFVHSYVDKEPTMVLIEGVKNGNPMVTIEPPLIIYKDKNCYTDEIKQIYGYE